MELIFLAACQRRSYGGLLWVTDKERGLDVIEYKN